jgi:hypothetical protein
MAIAVPGGRSRSGDRQNRPELPLSGRFKAVDELEHDRPGRGTMEP